MSSTDAGTGSADAPARAPRRGLAEKRRAITEAARTVFGREGYARAGVDTIAAEAGVSTRTIYNHFPGGKEQLFRTVIEESTAAVRGAQMRIMERHLDKIVDLEADLLALGREWASPMRDFPDHFALVRQINAEVGHLPRPVLESWQEQGPRAVHAELARRLRLLADRGLLDLGATESHAESGPAPAPGLDASFGTDPDAASAASHFVLLTGTDITQRSFWGALPLSEAEADRIAAAGVRAFLRAYLPK